MNYPPPVRRRIRTGSAEGADLQPRARVEQQDARWPNAAQDGRARAPPGFRDRTDSQEASTEATIEARLRRRSPPPPRFAHNLRIWALGGPCLGVLLLLGGRPTALVAAFGVMACYCFDLADNAEGALISVWGAVITSAGALAWTGSELGVVRVLNIVVFVALVGVWATLQFRFIYREDQDIARLLERLLFACLPLPAAAILTWTGVALGGAAYMAPCLALTLCAAVGLCAVPLRSGLGGGGASGVHGDSSRVAPTLCACMLLLPALTQVVVDRRLLVGAGAGARHQSVLKILFAAALPWPLLMSLRPRGVLWWAAPWLRRRLDKIISVGGPVSLLVLCETSKCLVLLPTFRPFLHSAPSPPFDSLLASAALYLLVLAWLVQGEGAARGTYAPRALTVASVRCLGLLLGVKQMVMPLFDCSALALSMLVFSGRRDLRAYMVGVAGLSSFMLWFSWQTVWHLSFRFHLQMGPQPWQAVGGGGEGTASLSLQQVSVCCAALSLAVLAVPGLAAFGVQQAVIGIVFGLQAVLLLLVEMTLIGAEERDPWQLRGLFPLPLVAVTGFLGAWMAVRLMQDRGVNPLFLWLPGSVNVAKVLACVVAGLAPLDQESSSLSYLITTFPVAAVVMAGTAPFALFEQHPAAAAFDTHPSVETRVGYGVGVGGGAAATGAPAGDWSGPMLPFEAGLCVCFMAISLFVCSRPVIAPLLEAVLTGGRSTPGNDHGGGTVAGVPMHAVAFCGVVLGLYLLAVVSRHFPDSRTGRRSATALLLGSMAVLALQPALEDGGAAAADSIRGGGGGGGGDNWREYLKQVCGVAMAGMGMLALTGIASPTKTLTTRAAFAGAIGAPLGAWSALASMPRADSAAVAWSALGAVGTYSCAVLILLEAALPRASVLSRSATRSGGDGGAGAGAGAGGGGGGGRTAGKKRGGPAVAAGSVLLELYVAVAAFMPVAAIAQGVQLLVFGPVGRRLMGFPSMGGISAEGAARFALATAATGHAVIAVALKFVGGGSSVGIGGGDGSGGRGGGGGRRGEGFGSAWMAGSSVSRAASEARWIPAMGNASAILAAAGAFLCCWVHLQGEGARALAAVPCCALLLLLQEDGRLFCGAGYVAAVPLGALSGAWAGSAGYYVLLKGSLGAGLHAPHFSPLSLFGGLVGPALSAYKGLLHSYHGAWGAADSRKHGEVAVALRAVSFWTSDTPWQPLWNLTLLAGSLPSHYQLVAFLWRGQGSAQRTTPVIAALAINSLPMIAGDLSSINLMGLLGLVGGGVQLWLMKQRRATGKGFI